MEKQDETVPRPEGLEGEQEEIVRPQNIRPAIIGARPTPVVSETNHDLEFRNGRPEDEVSINEFIAPGDGSDEIENVRARPRPTAQATDEVSLSVVRTEPRYSDSALNHEIEAQPQLKNGPEKNIECLRRAKHDHFKSRLAPNLEVPSFDGSASWPDFLIQFNMFSELNDWNEHEKLLYLGCSLRGVAREVLGLIDKSMRDTFDGLVRCLNQRFGTEKQEEAYKALLKHRVQEPNETFPELAHAIKRLIKNSYPEAPYEMQESIARDYFIDAISDVSVRNLVFIKGPSGLDEAVCLAIKAQCRKDHGKNIKHHSNHEGSFPICSRSSK